MRYVPPYAALQIWMARCAVAGNGRLAPAYDDVLDLLKKFLGAVPVDEEWYKVTYPAIGDLVSRVSTETAAGHFQKHGYFEGRKPFAPGWRDLVSPVPFARCYATLRMVPKRGRLLVDVARDDFITMIKNILVAVPVDERWYRAAYPKAAQAIGAGGFRSAAHHYVEQGYFEGCLPFEIVVDEDWYVSRYPHVRNGLKLGVAASAIDHFMRVGYREGCRPSPP